MSYYQPIVQALATFHRYRDGARAAHLVLNGLGVAPNRSLAARIKSLGTEAP